MKPILASLDEEPHPSCNIFDLREKKELCNFFVSFFSRSFMKLWGSEKENL